MVLELKLRKVGNSVGVVLPKEALAHLNVGEGDTLCVTDSGDGSLRLTPANPVVLEQLEVLNGWRLEAGQADAVVQTLGLAAGAVGEADYATWLTANSRQRL